MEQIEIEYSCSADMLAKAHKMHNARSGRVILVCFIYALICIGALQSFFQPDFFKWSWWSSLGIISGFLLYLNFLYLQPKKTAASIIEKHQTNLAPRRVIFTADNVTVHREIDSRVHSWNDFTKYYFNNELFLTHVGTNEMYMYPIALFTPEELAQVKHWAKVNIKH